MTTTMTEIRELDRDEMARVEGGSGEDQPGPSLCGFHHLPSVLLG
jgi:hypothetical protein